MDDHEQIRQLIARQIQRLDDKRLDEWLGAWADDGTFAIGGRTLEGKDAIREFVAAAAGGPWRGMHVLSEPVIDVDGDLATASTDYLHLGVTDAGGFEVTSLRRMHNRLRRTADGWQYVEATFQRFPESSTAPDHARPEDVAGSPEANKALVRTLMTTLDAALESGDFDRLGALYDPGFRRHSHPYMGNFEDGGADEAWRFGLDMARAAFGQRHHEVVQQIAEGDLVMTRLDVHLTHTGTFAGIPATGREVSSSQVLVHRVAGGRIVEAWSEGNLLGLLRQLGATVGVGTDEGS